MPNAKEKADRDRDNVVDMRLAKPSEPKLQFLFTLTPEDEAFWGIPQDSSLYQTQLDIAYRMLGCTPTEVGEWTKLIQPFTPANYMKEGSVFTKQGLIELFQFQWCVGKTVVARGEDWDILVALDITAGIQPNCAKRDILRDARNRAVGIPNLHPVEFEGLLQGRNMKPEQIAAAQSRVKINSYKVGIARYMELLKQRWEEYQQQSQVDEVINLNFEPSTAASSQSGLAVYNPQLNKTEYEYEAEVDVTDLIPIERMSHTISSFKKTDDDFENLARKLKVKNYQKGLAHGLQIGWAAYEGLNVGMEKAKENASEMLQE